MEITRIPGSLALATNVKRMHVPYTVTSTCPQCGVEDTRDFSIDYLSYPVLDKPAKVYFYHDAGDTDHNWEGFVILRLTLEVAEQR